MKKSLTFLIIILIFCKVANCQVSNDTTKATPVNKVHYKNFMGINLGSTTGLGLSYVHLCNKNGFQITFLPLIDKKNTYFSLGATYFHQIKAFRNSDFFLYWGNHLTNLFTHHDVVLNIGIGPGFDYYVDEFVVHFMFGYGIYNIPNNTMIRPAIEFGIFYQF